MRMGSSSRLRWSISPAWPTCAPCGSGRQRPSRGRLRDGAGDRAGFLHALGVSGAGRERRAGRVGPDPQSRDRGWQTCATRAVGRHGGRRSWRSRPRRLSRAPVPASRARVSILSPASGAPCWRRRAARQLLVPALGPRSGGQYLRHTPRRELDIAVVGVAAQGHADGRRVQQGAHRVGRGRADADPGDRGRAGAGRPAVDGQQIARAAQLAVEAARPISDQRGSRIFAVTSSGS